MWSEATKIDVFRMTSNRTKGRKCWSARIKQEAEAKATSADVRE